MGLAVLKDNELIEWKTRTFKGSWSAMKLKDILYALKCYIEDNGITVVAIKKPDELRSSSALDRLVSEITILAKGLKVKVYSYSLSQLKKSYSTEKICSKEALIKLVVKKNPNIIPEFNKELRNKNSYYYRMFEAIAVAQI